MFDRVHKTRSRLRDALVSLIHEKSYDALSVKEIVERADVGRTAFYTHFCDKDALLASGIDQMLHATAPRTLHGPHARFSRAVWFSFPVFDYIGRCGHAGAGPMDRAGRASVHQHLRQVLVERITEALEALAPMPPFGADGTPPGLLAEFVVGTFMLVLEWWMESTSSLSPQQVDDVFLGLVLPVLAVQVDGQ